MPTKNIMFTYIMIFITVEASTMVTEWVQEGVARARKLDDCNTFDANEALLLRQVATNATARRLAARRHVHWGACGLIRVGARDGAAARLPHADGLLKQLPLLG